MKAGGLGNSELPTFRLLLSGICAVLAGGFHIGFQISLISPLAATLQEFMVDSIQRLVRINTLLKCFLLAFFYFILFYSLSFNRESFICLHIVF